MHCGNLGIGERTSKHCGKKGKTALSMLEKNMEWRTHFNEMEIVCPAIDIL
jgi:hypothetical protein